MSDWKPSAGTFTDIKTYYETKDRAKLERFLRLVHDHFKEMNVDTMDPKDRIGRNEAVMVTREWIRRIKENGHDKEWLAKREDEFMEAMHSLWTVLKKTPSLAS